MQSKYNVIIFNTQTIIQNLDHLPNLWPYSSYLTSIYQNIYNLPEFQFVSYHILSYDAPGNSLIERGTFVILIWLTEP